MKNCIGTTVMLQVAREEGVKRFAETFQLVYILKNKEDLSEDRIDVFSYD